MPVYLTENRKIKRFHKKNFNYDVQIQGAIIVQNFMDYSVWKFGNFPASQILREISVWESGVSKSAIITVLGYIEFLHFDKADIY